MLHDLNIRGGIPETEIKSRLLKVEQQESIQLDGLQEQAVMEAVNSGLLIITGGPGTGKTTTINTIIRYFEMEGMEILLAAPTGRAAKRMTEATGCEARTIPVSYTHLDVYKRQVPNRLLHPFDPGWVHRHRGTVESGI